MSYNCFICDKLIKGNMFKAYDKNLCSYSCREHLIKKNSILILIVNWKKNKK